MISLLLALAATAAVQHDQHAAAAAPAAAAAACTASYPADLTAWPDAHPVMHGFVVGRTVELPARPVANVRLAIAPTKPLSGTHYASASFHVAQGGTYRIAAGGVTTPVKPLWLDVAGAGNRPLASTAHGHGALCTSITKVVDFTLAPGRYTVLATGLTSAAAVRVLVVRKP